MGGWCRPSRTVLKMWSPFRFNCRADFEDVTVLLIFRNLSLKSNVPNEDIGLLQLYLIIMFMPHKVLETHKNSNGFIDNTRRLTGTGIVVSA